MADLVIYNGTPIVDPAALRFGRFSDGSSPRCLAPGPEMRILENIISDRGSRYAVSGAPCASAEQAHAVLKELKRNKKFAKATHNSWALLCGEGPLRNDDGESGAGQIILRMLEREGVRDHIVVVTRWFGGRHLGGDRFRHVQQAVRTYLDTL
jgi:putative IMPACT (imprinted ancient) family translation regulator